MKTIIFAPEYREEERKNAKRLSNFLSATCSFLDSEIIQKASKNEISLADTSLLARLSLAMDIYTIHESQSVVIVLNGKDEAVLVKAGIAFAMGKRVYLYKYDPRVNFIAGENSMILGLSSYRPFSDASKLLKTIRKKEKTAKETDFERLTPVIKENIILGEKVYQKYVIEGKSVQNLLEIFKGESSPIISTIKDIKTQRTDFEKEKNKVYCSGPLFSSDEHREMKSIASFFEKSGFDTYLPQRDGAEPYFLSSMGSPMSGMIVSKPFINFVHKIIFTVDVKEIVECKYFAVNLNGRYYDEGAMAEVGMAYAMGKSIAVYLSDQRSAFKFGIHPILQAVSFSAEPEEDLQKLSEKLEQTENFLSSISLDKGKLSNEINICYKKGKRFLKLFSFIKKPKNKMLEWLEDYDEKS